MAKRTTRPILLQEENKAPITFECCGIKFTEINYDTEMTLRRDGLARKYAEKLTPSQLSENLDFNLGIAIALATKRVGETWTVQQFNENVELFEDNLVMTEEIEVIVSNFFALIEKFTMRGIRTLLKKMGQNEN